MLLALLGLAAPLAACSDVSVDKDYKTSSGQNPDNYEKGGAGGMYKNGSVASGNGGFSLFGGGDSAGPDKGGMGIGVNGYLWRATLDTVSFMPIAAADPFGGVITTDWYSAPATPNERMKLNILILDRDLRADGVKVTAFRQVRGADQQWADAPVAPTTGGQLEETILTRARQLRMAERDAKS